MTSQVIKTIFYIALSIFFLGQAQSAGIFIYDPFSNVLLNVFLFPLITFIFILRSSSAKVTSLYTYALVSSGISFLISLHRAWAFNFAKNGFQEIVHFAFMPSFSFALRLGVDGISLFFILLTNFFIFLCILSLSPQAPRLHEALLYLFFLQ